MGELEKVLRRYKSDMRFHTPGHKGRLKWFQKYAKLDITELSFSDNLLSPDGILLDANNRLAEAYGCDNCLMSTCGATSGVLTMLYAFRGKTLLIDRYSHKSVYHAIEMFDINPIFINETLSILSPIVDINEIEEKLDMADGAFLTYPNYFGRTFDIERVYNLTREKKKVMLVDSSHGSHFAYGDLLPKNAAKFSDISVMSVHKTCMALTQSAVICMREGLYERVLDAFCHIHSTSPSYLMCLSIDNSNDFMIKYYDRILKKQIAVIEKWRKILPIEPTDDIVRVVLNVSGFAESGFDVSYELEKRGIFSEMADFKRVVFIISPSDSVRKIERLFKAIAEILSGAHCKDEQIDFNFKLQRVREYNAICETEKLALENCEGRISAINLGLYPPGVPLVLKGELISKEVLSILKRYYKHCFGIHNNELEVQKVEGQINHI